MTRKPGSMYREIRGQAYSQRKYMGGVPAIRISQFDIGDLRAHFPVKLHLVAEEQCQIRHIALEVEDDGRGISAEALAKSRSLGVKGMRERMLYLGGGLDVSRAPRGGTRVRARVPLAQAGRA